MTTRSLHRFAAAFVLAAPTAVVVAQAPTVVPMSCVRPQLPAADKPLTEPEAVRINTSGKAFADCITAYRNARNAAIDESNAAITRAAAIGKANAEAATKAQEEMNSFQAALNANIAARNQAIKEGKFE